METRDFHCKIKSVTDTGTFLGFASTYGNTDLQDDIIEPGAFTQAINSQGSGYPVLWNHDPGSPIGKASISDSKAGLICKGALLLQDPGAKRAHDFMQADIIRGLSIGFTIDDPTAVTFDDDGVRHIKSLHLYEVSVVAFPANPAATITSVKSLAQVEKFLRFERARVSKGAAGMDDEMTAHLRAIHLHVLSMLEAVDPDDDVDDPLLEDDDEDEEMSKALVLELQQLAEQAQELADA